MTPELRAHIKRLVDEARRAKVAVEFQRTCCIECGGSYEDVSPGCTRCKDRVRNRANAAKSRRKAAA